MRAEQDAFLLGEGESCEPLANRTFSDEYRRALTALLPNDWNVIRGDIWLHAHDRAFAEGRSDNTPAAGFKIHVSSTPGHVNRVLSAVVPYCVNNNLPFKIAADPAALNYLNSKQAPRGSSGKFMTIYPHSEQAFVRHMDSLHSVTVPLQLDGPYILSDRRYKDSRILYYRFGGFTPIYQLAVDGQKKTCMQMSDGRLLADVRQPYFVLPDNVSDPFSADQPQAGATEEVLLAGRYAVDGVLNFSNSGGVYRGTDARTGRPIVIKEARPLTNLWFEEDAPQDAVAILKREYDVLDRLALTGVAPRPLDLFRDWEHTFLVEEYVSELTLDEFWARPRVLLAPYIHRAGRLQTFLNSFFPIALRLMEMIRKVHACGVLMGDLSTRNVMIDDRTLRMWFIDFESAAAPGDNPERVQYATRWRTLGFSRADRASRSELEPADDFYALGMILLNAIIPINPFLELHPPAKERFTALMSDMGLPDGVWDAIEALTAGDWAQAKAILSRTQRGLRRGDRPPHQPKTPDCLVDLQAEEESTIGTAVDAMADYILGSADYNRRDRLWACDHETFLTNPLNLAYGACGPALFLKAADRDIPPRLRDWLLSHRPNHADYAPGLCTGLSGIAVAFAGLGFLDAAEDALREADASLLLHRDASLQYGSAGWGTAHLLLHEKTGRAVHLAKAVEAGEALLAGGETGEQGRFWRSALDEKIHYGYGMGQAGIALFLLNLHRITGTDAFLRAAISSLECDLAAGLATIAGTQWPRHENDALLFPYMMHGSAGIGSVVARFASALGDERYHAIALALAEDAYVSHTFAPGLFEGMAGIGEFLVDAAHHLGEPRFGASALRIALNILNFRIDREGGLVFPGRSLMKIATDYGSGSAGIGLFMLRALRREKRFLFDP